MKATFVLLSVAAFFSLQLSGSDKDAVTPIIVAHPTFVNQSAPIPSTTLFTPKADGDFRLSAYVEAQPGNVNGAVCAQLSWTDDFAFQPAGGSAVAFLGPPGAAGDFGQTVTMVHAKAHTPITVEVPILTNVGCNIPPNYSLFVTVEELPKK